MEYTNASKLTFDPRPQMGRIFAEGFYEHGLKHISRNKAKLVEALAHIFKLESYYVACKNGVITAMTACTNGAAPPIAFDKKVMRKHFGFIIGSFAYFMLNKFMVGHKYPFEIKPQMGSIEFVAVSEEHRGRGIAGSLITHIIENTPYAEYVLEVADNNTPAVRLYEKLGFAEFMRTPAPKQSGFKEYVYMRKVL